MRTHVSIHVRDLEKSVAFYERVFGVKPQKKTHGYAKFDLQSPPLNFSLQSGETVSRVSHFGIEVDSPQDVKAWEDKLNENGILKAVETDSTCCFARQDKAWFQDPDGNEWEVFYVYEQLPISASESKQGSCCAG